ncbi:hypothetical protein ACFXOD_01155 [Streptomyces sp. NPDC059161]|uniref:SCO2400 family protein n=1 Tax=Streptomyces sp. NPDC059161 TaxID=3346749 RepID=UPI00368073AE
MDYCHSCQRHLNGALACAGCGTPAEQLWRAPEDELLVYAGAASGAGRAEVLAPSGHRRARKGRRARRGRGRVVVFGAAGLVLVAGAVGLVQMATQPSGDDRASAVRQDQTISDPQPLPSGSAAAVPVKPSGKPVASRGRKRGSESNSGSASGSASGDSARPGGSGVGGADPRKNGSAAGAFDPASPGPGPSGSAAPASPGPSGAPAPGGPGSSGAPSTAPAPPPPPSPAPKPTKTCTPFLFWCV